MQKAGTISLWVYQKRSRVRVLVIHSLFVFLLVMPPGASARAKGTMDGGGGTRVGVSPEEVREYVEKYLAGDVQRLIADGMYMQVFNPRYANDSRVKGALARSNGPSTAQGPQSGARFFEEAVGSRFVLKATCRDRHGRLRAGSTAFKKQSDICVSAAELENLSPNEMKLQARTIALHELLHHLQPAPHSLKEEAVLENEAAALQRYLMSIYKNLVPVIDTAHAKKNSGGASFFLERIFPGGKINLPFDGKSLGISCVAADSLDEQNGGGLNKRAGSGELAGIVVSPGSFFTVRDKQGRSTAVVCYDLPRVDCEVKQVENGLYGLQVGDGAFLTRNTREFQLQLLRQYEEAGRCKKVELPRPANGGQVPGEIPEASTHSAQ